MRIGYMERNRRDVAWVVMNHSGSVRALHRAQSSQEVAFLANPPRR